MKKNKVNNSGKSDKLYLKWLLEMVNFNKNLYSYSIEYLGGKHNALKQINNIKSTRNTIIKNDVFAGLEVVFVLDLDKNTIKRSDIEFNKKMDIYCRDNNFQYIKFCQDIEDVFLGKKLKKSKEKTDAAIKFTKNTKELSKELEKTL